MKKIKELWDWQKIGIICAVIVITGFVGWMVEFAFYYIDHGIIYWKGGNFLPWINMYSVGAFIIYICSYRYKKKPLAVFIISVISCGLLEFLTGFVLYRGFGIRYWDYTNEAFNVGGYVCLTSLIFIGIGGVFVMNFLLPILNKISGLKIKRVFIAVSVVLCVLVLSDEFYNFFITKLFNLPRAIDFYR